MALDFALERLLSAPLPGRRSVQRSAGTGLVLAGAALTYWAWEERRRRTLGDFDLEQPEELVTTGPYAINRHPMYLGWRLIHLGTGVGLGTSWVLVTFPAAMAAEFLGIPAEEAATAKRFGDAYLDYSARVPRYLPRWRTGTGNSRKVVP
ncbi:isoprenylcysteine carboxylmethyltransferase family protein [Arthrobacter sp. ISL-30]|uniref:methyltransferase family protein n=1 Tax=Arthrobacter sp. ISL-30 TaxID=2819109 RepID=UPI001BE9BA53|nr:isoprenylcysteine carboxylmethyltransferase family protein [Arthrobacter sp. ISL-30]MBT2514326.1 isoprenylcysteine carboxylmethyltransferase family protein [Arthrobacter sp. ISL-30]